MLLSGPKQIGKTGAVFQFLGLVQQFLKQQQEVQVLLLSQLVITTELAKMHLSSVKS